MKDPIRLSSFLSTTIPETDDPMASPEQQRQLQQAWRQYAPDIAPFSHPVLFLSGRLVAFTESPSWASAIRFRAASLARSMRESGLHVLNVQVKNQPAKRPPRTRPTVEFSISEESADAIACTANQIETPSLKSSLKRLARQARRRTLD